MENISNLKNSEEKVYLNIASSTHTLDDFINLDNHIFLKVLKFYPYLKPIIPKKYHGIFQDYYNASKKTKLIRHDCRSKLYFPDKSVDHILCSHFLEHIYRDEAIIILMDFYRVMKLGSTLHIIVPDIEKQVLDYLENKKNGEVSAADRFIESTLLSNKSKGSIKFRILELIGGFGLIHRWMYDNESMTLLLKEVGFNILNDNNTPSAKYRENDGSVHLIAMK